MDTATGTAQKRRIQNAAKAATRRGTPTDQIHIWVDEAIVNEPDRKPRRNHATDVHRATARKLGLR